MTASAIASSSGRYSLSMVNALEESMFSRRLVRTFSSLPSSVGMGRAYTYSIRASRTRLVAASTACNCFQSSAALRGVSSSVASLESMSACPGRLIVRTSGKFFGNDQRSVRRELSCCARQPAGEVFGALFAETDLPCQSAQQGGHRRLETQYLARAEKGALKEGRTILFADQSGFYMLPAVVRSYAPVGQTPVLHEQLSHDHLSAMSAITLEGKLLMMEQEGSFKGPDMVKFLKHALNEIPGKLLVIWDGSPIHRSRAVKDFLADAAAGRIQLEQLPGYAPDLNPDEGIWKHLKYTELKNICCSNLAELRVELRRAKERLRHKKHVIEGCIRQPGFEV